MSDWTYDQFEKLMNILKNLASMDSVELGKWQEGFKRFSNEAERQLTTLIGSSANSVELTVGARERQHVIDLLPKLQNYQRSFPAGHVFDVLHADCGYGYGTNLLGSLYLTSALGYRCRVAGYQIGKAYRQYTPAIARHFAYVSRPLESIERKYDIVFSVFQIQKTINAAEYCARLQRLASGRVFISAPYNETEQGRTKGHLMCVDDAFLASLNARAVEIYQTQAWGANHTPHWDTVSFELPGTDF